MRRRTLLLVALLAAAALAGCTADDDTIRDSYDSAYEYDYSIRADGTLTNVTLYVPLAVENGSSPVAERILVGQNMTRAERRNGSAFDGSLPDWNYSVVDTRYGPMLAIRTDVIRPRFATPQPIDPETGEELEPPQDAEPVPETHSLHVRITPDERIATACALRHEPTLQPKLNVTLTPDEDCDPVNATDFASGRYDTRFMLRYDANASTEVDTSVRFEGYNTWFTGGWEENRYHEDANAVVSGPQDGWVVAAGAFEQGDGDYLEPALRRNVTPGEPPATRSNETADDPTG